MSNLGKPDRQLWYELRSDLPKEEIPPQAKFKFLYGDLIEEILFFLAEQAGHEVKDRQKEVVVDGVVGHIDGVVDGVLVDAKSASTFAFKKFKNGTLAEDDPFGYYDQMASYAWGLGGLDGGWLAADKQNGHLAFLGVPWEELKALDIEGRIEHVKEMLSVDAPPGRCYEDVPEGEGGNRRLDVGCSYCPFKFDCWSDANSGVGLRTFLYSRGPVHFTHVEKEPRVMELTF